MKKWHARDHRGQFLCMCNHELEENDYISRTWKGVNCEDCLKLKPTVESVSAKIAEFTKEKNESDGGGYAPVNKGEVSCLWDIIRDILLMKYEEDCDGDLPLEVDIVDRNKYQRNRYRAVPYDYSRELTRDDRMKILDTLSSNADIANKDLSQFIHIMQHNHREEVEKA